ncbi:nose resistant to fluoxetine protein 6-like [Anneissia japonica]|uniref:nose resistant to fluoxetine protein 6-like n=1 Tax=Anneissia japonica TaxID=1529436 RepID=UPI001425B740|nr:nose resistant to fluoxetine protein 6-like [Anneissia japonica]
MYFNMRLSVILTYVFANFYCNAQFHVNNGKQASEFLSKNKRIKTPRNAEDVMDHLVYSTLLQPMLQSVEYQLRSHKLRNRQEFFDEMKPATLNDLLLLEYAENMTPKMLKAGPSTKDFTTESLSTTPESPSQCIVDLGYFNSDLQAGDLYALMMVDAYGKLPPGVFQGSITWPGLYDQCQSQSKSSNVTNFEGKHCIVFLYNANSNASFPSLNIGMCVPNSCDAEQIKSLLNSLPIDTGFTVTNTICTKVYEYSAAAIACLTTLTLLCVMIIIGTIYDLAKRRKESAALKVDDKNNDKDMNIAETTATYNPCETSPLLAASEKNVIKQNDSFFGKFILCFSMITNGSKILKTKQEEGSLGALNGIRVLSLFWVILGHTYSSSIALFSNILTLFDVIARFSFQAIANATFSVDSFFFLSGLLVTYLTLNYMKKNNGRLNWVMFYVHRYLRLTPVYMLVIFIFTTLTPYFATGPFYSYLFDPNPAPGVETQITYCQDYWWTNLLYINNLYPSELMRECLAWGWYLANDMQFFIISPFIIYLLYHYFFAGVAAWCILLLTCFSSLIGESIKHDLTTEFIPEDPNQLNFTTDSIYVQPWSRISPYLVGMAVGYILYKYRGRVRMSIFTTILGWVIATVIDLAVVYGLYGNFHDNHLSKGGTVVYITLCRFAWAVSLAWVAFACATGYGGPVNSLLSWSAWVPLARINYCAYLIHPIVISVFYFSLPNMIYFTDFLMVYFFLGNLVLSYACAFIFSVCAEAPFMALEKLLLKREKSV